jgi:hypothetical protein
VNSSEVFPPLLKVTERRLHRSWDSGATAARSIGLNLEAVAVADPESVGVGIAEGRARPA